ncbi:MAG: hypothetical protein U0470_12935 [Anaerolineae bacterium]
MLSSTTPTLSTTSTTSPPTATPTPAARVVAITVAEVRATVWAGIVAAPEPRIEGAIVVDRERLVKGWPVAATFLQRDPSAWKHPDDPPLLQYERGTRLMQPRDSWMLPAAAAASFNLPPTNVETLIFVRGSVGRQSYQLTGSERGGRGASSPPGARDNFEVFFDASTGKEVYADGYAPSAAASLLEAFAYATTPALATRTPNPSASPTPGGCRSSAEARSGELGNETVELSAPPPDATDTVRLAPGQVPSPLVGIATALGLVPGARRRYRSTSTRRPSDWSGNTATELNDAAWRIAPDVMLVRTTWTVNVRQTGCAGNLPKAGVDWRYVFPHAVVGRNRFRNGTENGLPPIADARWLVEQRREWMKGDLVLQQRWPWVPGEAFGWLSFGDGQGGAIEDVFVPAGHFTACRGFVEENNVGTIVTWFCPFVGPTRADGIGGNPPGWSSRQLLSWTIPPIIPVGHLPTANPNTSTPSPPTLTTTSTPTSKGTPTATSTRYPTVPPAPTPAPHIVALTLEDARASVREHMAAAPDLRVGEAAYVSGEELFERWPYRPGSTFDDLMILNDADILAGLRADDAKPKPLAHTLIAVEGSIGEWHERWLRDDGWVNHSSALTQTTGCAIIDGAPRSFFHVFIDARSGRWVGAAWLDQPWQTCMLRSLTEATPSGLSFATESAAGTERAVATATVTKPCHALRRLALALGRTHPGTARAAHATLGRLARSPVAKCRVRWRASRRPSQWRPEGGGATGGSTSTSGTSIGVAMRSRRRSTPPGSSRRMSCSAMSPRRPTAPVCGAAEARAPGSTRSRTGLRQACTFTAGSGQRGHHRWRGCGSYSTPYRAAQARVRPHARRNG